MPRKSVGWARIVAFLLFVMGGAGAASAQQVGLSGTVREAASRNPVADAEVRLAGGAGTRTDSDGRFRLSAEPGDTVELSVRKIGFAPESRRITLPQSGAMQLEFLLEASTTTLVPMVVTATREQQSLADVPAAVAVADSFVIKSGRTAGLHEVLRYTPGMQATSRFGLDDVNLSIRGSGIRTTFGVRGVAIMLDGVPLTEPDGQTRLDLLELAAAKQVEVLRGPASALYGGVASGGAINIISRTGAESRGLSLRAQRGSFGFEKYDGAYGGTFAGDRGSVYLSGAHTWSDGFRDFNTNQMTRLTLRSDYKLGRYTRLGLDASTSDLDMRIPGALNETEFDVNPYQAAATNVNNNYARRDQRWRAGLRLDQGFLAGGAAQATAYGFYGGRTLDHPIFQLISQNLHRVQLGGRVKVPVDRLDDPRLKLTVGAEYDNLFGVDNRYANVPGSAGAQVYTGYLSLPTFGVYTQAEARLAAPVTLTAGVRYDRVRYDIDKYAPAPAFSEEKAFDQVSPRVMVSWRLSPQVNVYGSVARGFEVPTNSELTTSPDPNQPINNDLVPKTLWNYEVGVKTLVANRLFLDASLFRANVRGEFLPRTIPTPTGPRPVFENAGRSRQTGLEFAATLLAAPWLDVIGSYTFADYVLTDFQALQVQSDGTSQLVDFSGNKLPGVPRHRFGGEARFRPLQNLSASVGAEWQSQIFVENGNGDQGTVYFRAFGSPAVLQQSFRSVPAYALVHLSASYQLGPTTIFGSVENLFDKTYVGNITVNDGTGRFYSAGSGRYIALGASVAAFKGGF